jgi:hypothetical protein
MDVVWSGEFFEEYEGRAFGNPQNEQLALYREHFRSVTALKPELRPDSWGDIESADPEHKDPFVFKPVYFVLYTACVRYTLYCYAIRMNCNIDML